MLDRVKAGISKLVSDVKDDMDSVYNCTMKAVDILTHANVT